MSRYPGIMLAAVAAAGLWLTPTAVAQDESASGPNAALMGELSPRLLAVSVGDLDRSIAWYEEMLGFSVESRHDFPEDNMRLAFVKRGGFELELIEIADSPAFSAPDSGNPATRQGFVKLAFESSDIQSLYEQLSAKGAEIQSTLRGSNRTGGRFFIVLDPDGNWIQVYGS